MSIKIEKTENNNELKLEFTIEAAKFDEAMKKVYLKSVKYINVPGFRKGKVPMNMVEKYYGEEVFYEDTFNEVVPAEYDRELKENNIEAVSRPDIEVTQIGKGKDLIFTAIVQTKPEVKLGKYKGIELKKKEYNVTDEDINKELSSMQDKNSRLVAVEGRAVESGDTTINTFIPGFEDQIIGMEIDEQRDIKVKFPEEYFSKELAGKDATFKVKLHEIKKKELPELDDEFAKDASEFDTLEELKNSIKTKKEEENSKRAKYELEDEAIKTVCQKAKLEIPSGMIETETDNMVNEMEARLSYQGMSLEQYLGYIGKDMDSFRKEYEPQAQEAVKTRLVLEAIVKAENIEAGEEEVNAKIEEMAKQYGKEAEELKKNDQFVSYVKDSIKSEAVIKFIIDNAKIK